MKTPLTIVTAASSNHSRCLKNLLWSIEKSGWNARVMVWNIGLNAAELQELDECIASLKIMAVRKDFDFSKYPPHFQMDDRNRGWFAWRASIMAEEFRQAQGVVAWFDAGNLVCGNQKSLCDETLLAGIYLPRQGKLKVKDKLDAQTYDALDAHPHLEKIMRDPCQMAFDTANPAARELIDRWEKVSMNTSLIAPSGAWLHSHNPDAILSVLAYQVAAIHGLRLHESKFIYHHQDHLDFNQMKFMLTGEIVPRYEWSVRKPFSRNQKPSHAAVPLAMPRTKWPEYITAIAAQKIEGECGAGDTVERMIGKFGSEEFRAWFAEKRGVMAAQCRCAEWKTRWNIRFAYK